ncbi:unnamed protein product [Protopolystoma xenopodis]|uniref:Uncharacterized protein n=1 Tax=Protopolystoma xenopodis TaxID=117903 RepID=A0A448X5X3_9PLAT|nr:unnamed protein product [Protopolystoma xenopodis]
MASTMMRWECLSKVKGVLYFSSLHLSDWTCGVCSEMEADKGRSRGARLSGEGEERAGNGAVVRMGLHDGRGRPLDGMTQPASEAGRAQAEIWHGWLAD